MAELDSKEIVTLVSSFQIPGWTTVDPGEVELQPITHGYINTTCVIKKKSGHSLQGPANLLYRKFGNDRLDDEIREMTKVNTPWLQNLIANELSKRNWGPKVFGLYEEGRIEEFIDCHTLNHDESFEPQMVMDIAKSFARLHSLQLPIDKKAKNSLCDFAPQIEESLSCFSKWLATDAKDWLGECEIEKQNLGNLLKFPFREEVDWLIKSEGQIEQRIVLCHLDPSYLNVLVRHKEHLDESETRTWIIDFDISAYSHRGRDLGAFFTERTLNWSGKESKLSGKPYPNEAERTLFYQNYLAECRKLFSDFDSNSLDSVDHLALEAHFHSLSHILILSMILLKCFKLTKDEPFFYNFLDPYFKLYWHLKDTFVEKYPQFAT